MTAGRRPTRPTIAQLREITQPPAVRGRRTAEHWTGDLYMRRISPYVVRVLLPTGISANGVTWLMIVSGWLAAPALLLPGIAGAVLAVLCTQLQMMWDACDGEVARWRGTASPMGIFLDKVGHYTVETLIALALGVRAAGGAGEITDHLGWICLGALLAWLLCLNKALNDMVHSARAAAGLARVADTAEVSRPRSGLLAGLRQAARFVPFHRIYHSIELSLIILVAAVVDAVAGGLDGTRVLLAVVVPLALLSVLGHFVAIVASHRVRA
ncbi:CDP-alcohol phosphatidyltransferase family protein [Jatrophihabitans sp.]|uniref:CDP-alcohol phosphatidyltransferase family protein n=1 Tax=Jatrophihabitans sp. TaxID=1932789 RepID=UPI002EEBAE1F